MTSQPAGPKNAAPPPKPRSTYFRRGITGLPRLTWPRRAFRRALSILCRWVVRLCTRCVVSGLGNFPAQGPALVVVNHLGDADVVVGLAFLPSPVDALAKVEMYDFPVAGFIMDIYGVIWVHRGQPDRRALRSAQQGFDQGRFIGIAPEGRESLTGSLEEGEGGAAFLALRSDVPIIPVTFTGTENEHIFGSLKRLRRPEISLTVGRPFRLEQQPDRREAIRQGTEQIMEKLAQQLPPEYRGKY